MRELKDELERRAAQFDWEQGAMQRMFERGKRRDRRRKAVTTIVALVIGLAGVAAISRSYGDPGSDVPAVTPTTTAVAIPDGVYWTRPVRRAEIVATLHDAGFSRTEGRRWFFSRALTFDRWIREGLVVQNGSWFQTAKADTGEEEAGWSGNYEVLDSQRIRATGYGCTLTYRYAFDGAELTLHLLSERGAAAECGTGDRIAQTAIFDPAPFVLTQG